MTKLLVSMLFAALMFTAGCSGGASTTPRATNTPRPATSVPTQAPTPEPTAAPADSAALAEGITALDQVVSDFTLVNQKGEETRLSDLQGKLIVLSFGYTHCPDVCPITLAQFGRVRNLLGEDAEQVQFVFISVDGTRDTPERLAQYLPVFNADILGLTGDDAVIRTIISEYGGEYTLNNAGGLRENYTVDHTASKFLIDANGHWRRTYGYNLAPDVIAADIQSLLAN